MTRRNSLHTIALEVYAKNESLLLCSGCTVDEVLFTYINEFTGSRSKLERFITSETLSSDVCRYYSIHGDDNLSDRIPIVADLTLSSDHFNDIQGRIFFGNASWQKGTPGQIVSYRDVLSNLMDGIEIRIITGTCKSPHHCTADILRGTMM